MEKKFYSFLTSKVIRIKHTTNERCSRLLQHYAGRSLVGCQIYTWRTRHIFRNCEYFYSRHNVYLLLVGRNGTQVSEVLVVEEALDHNADGSVCHSIFAYCPALLHRLQFPQDPRLHHVLPLNHVFRSIFELLHSGKNFFHSFFIHLY